MPNCTTVELERFPNVIDQVNTENKPHQGQPVRQIFRKYLSWSTKNHIKDLEN